jgi:hypothetical protein
MFVEESAALPAAAPGAACCIQLCSHVGVLSTQMPPVICGHTTPGGTQTVERCHMDDAALQLRHHCHARATVEVRRVTCF